MRILSINTPTRITAAPIAIPLTLRRTLFQIRIHHGTNQMRIMAAINAYIMGPLIRRSSVEMSVADRPYQNTMNDE